MAADHALSSLRINGCLTLVGKNATRSHALELRQAAKAEGLAVTFTSRRSQNGIRCILLTVQH